MTWWSVIAWAYYQEYQVWVEKERGHCTLHCLVPIIIAKWWSLRGLFSASVMAWWQPCLKLGREYQQRPAPGVRDDTPLLARIKLVMQIQPRTLHSPGAGAGAGAMNEMLCTEKWLLIFFLVSACNCSAALFSRCICCSRAEAGTKMALAAMPGTWNNGNRDPK